jgi:DNA-binding GntR family transcriptional regulator
MGQPAEPRGERARTIYQALRLAIMEHALVPGTKLPEDAIGEQFGASRTIVRRALEQLASEELVDIRLNRGATVARPTPEEAKDIFSVRQAVEQLVLRHFRGQLTRPHAARLKAYIDAEEEALHANKAAYIRLAAEFHVVLAEMSGSQVLLRYTQHLVGRSALVLALYGRPQWTNCSMLEHRDLLKALVQGDIERAGSIMHAHLDSVMQRALESANGGGSWSVRDVLAIYARDSGAGSRPIERPPVRARRRSQPIKEPSGKSIRN